MMKLILAGVWGAALAFGGAFVSLTMQKSKTEVKEEKKEAVIEQVGTELTGVPVIAKGRVEGYLLFKLTSSVDRSKLNTADLVLAPYIYNAAFLATYAYVESGVDYLRARDLDLLTKYIKKQADIKLGEGAVVDVNIEQFNYIRADEVRANLFKVKEKEE